ncbi:hypothetical protein [Calothrix sp. PCC 6303]|nr:hypothetical protein [Calothrix sp. PCC 6303]
MALKWANLLESPYSHFTLPKFGKNLRILAWAVLSDYDLSTTTASRKES